METVIEILKYAGPILAGFGISGIITAIVTVRGSRPKVTAEAQKINMDIQILPLAEWQKLSADWERRFNRIEEKYDTMVAGYETKIQEYIKIDKEKDKRIDGLEDRIGELEGELKKYQGQEVRTEVAREELHHEVDIKMDDIKNNKTL